VVCRELNTPVVVEEIELDSPREHEILVKIAACGVCHSDLSATNGTIQLPPPIILGHEAAGEVVAVGAAVREFTPGDRIISSFVYSCGGCRYCVAGRPNLCDEAQRAWYTLPDGSTRARDQRGVALNVFSGCGVMAEYAVLHVNNAVKIPNSMPLDCAALIGCAVTTGVGAVFNTAAVEPGTSAVVFGCGGVGLNVVQGCVLAGCAHVIAVDPTEAKLEFARAFGATRTIDTDRIADVVKEVRRLTGGGADYAFECVGSGRVVETAFRATRKGGKTIVVGMPHKDDTTSLRTVMFPLEEKSILGSWFGSARPRYDYQRLIGLFESGRLMLRELVTRSYPIEAAPRAFDDLQAGRNARGLIRF
jgi:S-(hydroxymethyl)glutathione dehydrogenase/alcohol dehydrogenase